MHGGGGASNSKARRKVLEQQIFGSCKKRACYGGGRSQIELEDSRSV